MESIETRLENVTKFLKTIKRDLDYNVVPIYDDFGPTRTDGRLQALVGSLETAGGCDAGRSSYTIHVFLVNSERKAQGLLPLDIYIIGVMSESGTVSQDQMHLKISSSAIREWLSKRQESHL